MIKERPEPRALTPRERACIEHMQAAQKQQVSFAQYCRENGMKSSQWHWVKHTLVHKGVLPPPRKPQRSVIPQRSGFIPVRLTAPPHATEVVCRIRLPQGWTLECVSWPEPLWLSQLMAGEQP